LLEQNKTGFSMVYHLAMDVNEALLDSWDRQCRIVEAVGSLIDETNRHVKPSEDGWPLDKQLAHMHKTRKYFLTQIAPEQAARLGDSYADEMGTPIADLATIKSNLTASGLAVRETVREGLARGMSPMAGPNATYDNPVLFLQHMVWHDGWHVGLIFLALRLNGQEPPEEWDEPNVWGLWRTEVW
jgi:uncharacterized damage-inducible protein DinB